ncbi:MAG: chromosome segregation SMC family protein, partial [Ilumatobacteraceae bacterium]
MFLKRLTLKGFKSFAEATTLDLEPGVTVVVGPNGSGKSNVVDAIAWVLGAQAPSAVRSQKMDDVIFAGTASRPALGRAEVTLTIDNSAGLLGIEFTELTVRRTLFRTGDSEYAINDVPCRLLDLQELLSDAGVGRQQHVIVSQGQIDAVLNARPEDRRAIIEEAAGVLKYRKRKEKAERRLDATEASLLRVQDLLREVRRQLRPLERQAQAATRHEELIGELTALRIHVAGRELGALRTRLTGLAAAKLESASAESELKSELARLDADVVTVGAELSARGGEDVGERLAVVEQLGERARGLAAVVAERRRSLERDRGQLLDAGVVATLEGDAARCRTELHVVRSEQARFDPERAALERDERAFLDDRQTSSVDGQGGAASAARAAAEVRGELRSRRAGVERAAGELTGARERASTLGRVAVEAEQRIDRFRHDCNAAELVETPLVEQIARTDTRVSDAERDHADAIDAQHRASEAAASAAGRVEALQLALDAVHARAGAERLADLDGVVGTLLDVVRIEAGWERAVEAALGEAL